MCVIANASVSVVLIYISFNFSVNNITMKDFLIVLYTPYQITVPTNTIYISITYSGYRVYIGRTLLRLLRRSLLLLSLMPCVTSAREPSQRVGIDGLEFKTSSLNRTIRLKLGTVTTGTHNKIHNDNTHNDTINTQLQGTNVCPRDFERAQLYYFYKYLPVVLFNHASCLPSKV